HAEQHFVASFGEGYWTDHWFYNLDLLETYLAVYPDKKADLLFGQPVVPFFDSPAVVQPRARKYRLVDGKVRQYGAAVEDAEKVALIAARTASPNLMRTAHGHGAIYRTTVAGKLLALALVKFATLDPWGMGVEMEAGRPSWCDALNGLPGLFGSSLPETFELARLLAFLIEALTETAAVTLRLPVEFHGLLQHTLDALSAWEKSTDADRDFSYWDAVATAREAFRAETRLGFAGDEHAFTAADLLPALRAMLAKVEAGLQRAVALNDGLPPTYFAYTVTDYTLLAEEGGQTCVTAKHFEPTVLPLYLEGPVHALKLAPDVASARRLYTRIRESALFDRDLAMYRLNASLTALPHEIGRARAFTPGWLENESVWLHMEYKYLLEVLKAGLDEEFLEDFKRALIPFQDPQRYGRSPLENSSFLVSSAHPDVSLHGAGFVARFTGATAEFLNIWSVMMAGRRPFFLRDGELCLTFRPVLPGWLFRADGTLTFTFLGQCAVTYHIPERVDTCTPGLHVRKLILQLRDGQTVEIAGE
ncbi:MAG TPA: cellobiose phosphorylase, partial [Anaerolineae bacterium]|nr:cellobiose phosphorylase [Anaerolineae bacterium]